MCFFFHEVSGECRLFCKLCNVEITAKNQVPNKGSFYPRKKGTTYGITGTNDQF